MYLDFESGQVCASVGHSHPDFVAAIKGQVEKLVQTGARYVSDTEVRFQRALAGTTSGRFEQSYLACSGSESNEAALKLARTHTGRSEVVSLMGNYHGMTFGSWSLTGFGGAFRRGSSPPMPGVTFLPTPYDYIVPGGDGDSFEDESVVEACVTYCERLLDMTTTGEPAAIFVELIQSAVGVRTLPKSFVRALRRICDERGALMVVDEAQTGVGRLGEWWGFDLFDVVPDVVTASKTLGGGAPLSAMLVSSELGHAAVERGYRQTSSHTGDPLLCAAGLATIEIIEREGLLDNVKEVGGFLKQRLEALTSDSPVVTVRGEGLLLGMQMVRSKVSGTANPDAARIFADACRERGLLTGWGWSTSSHTSVVRLMPPYTLTLEEAEEALDIIAASLEIMGDTGVE